MVESHTDEQYRHIVKAPAPHVHPVTLYWGVFAALVMLTVLTVTLAGYDFGSLSVFVTLFIAGTKSILVMAVFMHLWFDNKFFSLIISATLVFLSLFVLFPIFDAGSRGFVDPVKSNFLPRDEVVYQHQLKTPDALPLRPGLKEAVKEDLVFIGTEAEHETD